MSSVPPSTPINHTIAANEEATTSRASNRDTDENHAAPSGDVGDGNKTPHPDNRKTSRIRITVNNAIHGLTEGAKRGNTPYRKSLIFILVILLLFLTNPNQML